MSYMGSPTVSAERAVVYASTGQEVFEALVLRQVDAGPPVRIDLAYWDQSILGFVTRLGIVQGDTKNSNNVWDYVDKDKAGLAPMDAPTLIDGRCVTYFDGAIAARDAAISGRGAGLRPILQLHYWNATTQQFVDAPDVPHREEAGQTTNVWRWIDE